jgi:hypothetical protein
MTSRLARRLIDRQGIWEAITIDTGQASRQNRRVLDGHGGTLSRVGCHGVAGIAEKGNVSFSPTIERIVIAHLCTSGHAPRTC